MTPLSFISFVVTVFPPVVLVIIMWGMQLGIPLNGVCTLGYQDGSDIVCMNKLCFGIWSTVIELLEVGYAIINIIFEIYLSYDTKIGKITKNELLMLVRWSTGLVVYDIIFRSGLVGLIATDTIASVQ
jgi:hypothetical protein